MVAILYNIRSLANVGSIFRTADGAGVEKIYLLGITPTPRDIFGSPRSQLTKLSLGAEKYVPWEHLLMAKSKSLIAKLRKESYKIVALELAKKAVPYHKWSPPKNKKIALILGNEVRGLPSGILKQADIILEIPMSGKKESLNVSVAFGVVAFHIRDHT